MLKHLNHLGLLLILFALFQTGVAKEHPQTTFYLVRHAEKAVGSGDVSLSGSGFQMAVYLADALSRKRISAVYATSYQRTQLTASVLAKRAGLEIQMSPTGETSLRNWAKSAINKHEGEAILVVGHSNTIPVVIKALAGQSITIHHDEFDRLFELRVGPDEVQLINHRYGPLSEVSKSKPTFTGKIRNGKDISAIEFLGKQIIVAADEEDALQVLSPNGQGEYKAQGPLHLGSAGEIDIEALCFEEPYLYALGSHSKKRKKVAPRHQKSQKRSYSQNRRRMSTDGIKPELSRHRLYRLKAEHIDKLSAERAEYIELSSILSKDRFLQSFVPLPSKENGIDMEGLAVKKDLLFLGFRAPVLREGYVPVLSLNFDKPTDYQVDFLNLGGRGIRSLCQVSSGFLVLAGPMGDAEQSFQLYHWDGRDTLPGQRKPGQQEQGVCRLLGDVPTPPGAKAEGMTLLSESDDDYKIILVYDGLDGGQPRVFQVPKDTPHSPAKSVE